MLLALGAIALVALGILIARLLTPRSHTLAGTTIVVTTHPVTTTTAPATVPNLIGRSLQDAVSTLQGAHLRLIYLRLPVSSRARAGKIVQQSPLGGGHAPQNARVLVFLGAYRAG
jgi:beta-lactam-binding protein with PASTA domain